MSLWIYPGSFDPITLGHVDIIRRAAGHCDRLVVAVLVNVAKAGVFSVEERMEMIRSAIAGIPHVEVDAFSGLQVDYVRRMGADAVVRGLRTIGDFAAEQELDACNRKLYPDMETIFFMTSPAYTFVSSSAVREVGRFGGDLSGFVPGCIQEQVARRLRGD